MLQKGQDKAAAEKEIKGLLDALDHLAGRHLVVAVELGREEGDVDHGLLGLARQQDPQSTRRTTWRRFFVYGLTSLAQRPASAASCQEGLSNTSGLSISYIAV